jgi:hypothetical protein
MDTEAGEAVAVTVDVPEEQEGGIASRLRKRPSVPRVAPEEGVEERSPSRGRNAKKTREENPSLIHKLSEEVTILSGDVAPLLAYQDRLEKVSAIEVLEQVGLLLQEFGGVAPIVKALRGGGAVAPGPAEKAKQWAWKAFSWTSSSPEWR